MMRLAIHNVSLILIIAVHLNPKTSFVLCENWVLKWSEHFNDTKLNRKYWNTVDFVYGDKYVCFDDHFRFVNNALVLKTEKLSTTANSNAKCKIRSGRIETNFGFLYGKFEINASVEYNNAVAFISLLSVVKS